MKILKKNWLILSIVLLVVAMVLIRNFSPNCFRYDAVRWAAASADRSNIISADQLAGEGERVLLISLGSPAEVPVELKGRTVTIPPGEILGRENIRVIRKNKGPVVLFSGDGSVSARVWMVLSETGIKNLYILADKNAETP